MNERMPKKSETFEIRLPYELKQALMRKAQDEGRSASEVMREFIANYVAGDRKEPKSMMVALWKPAAAATAAGAAILWTAFAPTAVSAGPDLTAAFEQLDRNGDKLVSLSEFVAGNKDIVYFQEAGPGSAPVSDKPFTLPIRQELPAPPPGSIPAPAELLQSEFTKQDRDGNGSVTMAEFQAFHAQMIHDGFSAIDTDRDGALNPAEYRAAVAAPPGGGAAARFEDLDRNHDGGISEDEFAD